MNDPDLVLRVARTIGEIESLREHWSACKTHRDSDIDFYRMIVECYPECLRPHVISLWKDGRPEVILVGRLDEKPVKFRVGYVQGGLAKARCLTFVYAAIHGEASPHQIDALIDAVVSSVDAREADVALLEFIPIQSALFRTSLDRPGLLRRDFMPAEQVHRVMTVPASIDDVYGRMSSKHRKNLRREIRQLFAHPEGTRIVCYRDKSEIDMLFRDAESVAQRTYQRGLGAGFGDTPQIRQRLLLAASKGWLRANILYLGDRPIAFWIGMLYGDSFVSEYMGYDPDYREWSPGMVLIMRVIEDFCSSTCSDAVRELDFGLGDAEYKATLCTDSWKEASVYIFSRRPKGLLLKSARICSRLIDHTLRRALSSTSIFRTIKRTWRKHLAKVAQRAAGPVGA